jgi:hypothetical protein
MWVKKDKVFKKYKNNLKEVKFLLLKIINHIKYRAVSKIVKKKYRSQLKHKKVRLKFKSRHLENHHLNQ